MLGLRIVSYGMVGAVAILTHETTKAYKERLYHWAKEKFKSHDSPPQPGGPPQAENQPTTHQRGDAHLSSPQLQQQQQQQLTVIWEDNDALPFLPQLQHHQQPTTTTTITCEEDAHLSVLLQPQQQLTSSKKDDDIHLSVLQQQQQLTTADKENVANLPMLQQQELTAAAAANDHDANYLLVQQEFTAASNIHDACIPAQQQQLTAIGKDDDVYDLNDDQAVKTSHLIGTEFELKGSSETSKDHEFDDVRTEGGAKHEQQGPRLPGGGATFFAKVFNAAKSQLHGFFCWARGLFEDKRWSTVRGIIARIARKIFLLLADDLFHYTFKGKHPGLYFFN